MNRSSKVERVQRINAALELLQQHVPAEAARILADRFRISYRQSYRYVQAAEEAGELIPLPRPKMAFTVKLPQSLIQRLREYAKSSGHSLSEIVTQAVEAFLGKRRERGEKNKTG
jgi:hypothetical protein